MLVKHCGGSSAGMYIISGNVVELPNMSEFNKAKAIAGNDAMAVLFHDGDQ